jgi:hypothetical protein
MRYTRLLLVLAVMFLLTGVAVGQTQKALTNADILTMTKNGFAPNLIITAIKSSRTDFDVSAQALVDLKSAGVDQSVLEAMLSAQATKPSAAVEAAHGSAVPTESGPSDPSKPACTSTACLLRDSTTVPLKFLSTINSKTAHEGDPVEFILDEDLKVGDEIVVPKGAHAVAIVTTAKKAGMLGKPGDLSIQLEYLIAGANHVHLRGTKGREGEGKTGATVALTVIFGPIGLIKHGKNVEIAAGTTLTAFVDQDIWLPETKAAGTQ